jgi:hypothetical protein
MAVLNRDAATMTRQNQLYFLAQRNLLETRCFYRFEAPAQRHLCGAAWANSCFALKKRKVAHGEEPMTDRTIDLDTHRGMAAQKETSLRRLHAEVREQRDALRARQDALEEQLVAAAAESWEEAAEKARYLLNLFAASVEAQDPRRQKLIAAVLEDFRRLSGEPSNALTTDS